MKPAWVGIDVACAKGKHLPVVVCVRTDGALHPLPLRQLETLPPQGEGNARVIDPEFCHDFAARTKAYLHEVERHFGVRIERVAIDAPSSPKPPGAMSRHCERSLQASGISCYPTPDAQAFDAMRRDARAHLAGGGAVARIPGAFRLWMMLGFALFRELGQEWECLEVFPQATIRRLGSGAIHKSHSAGLDHQLDAVAAAFGKSRLELDAQLESACLGPRHDRLDAFLCAWVASLDEQDREAFGDPPDDVIWVPKYVSQSGSQELPRHAIINKAMVQLLTVVAEIKAKPGKEDALRKAVLSMIEPTRKEAGCVQYDLHVHTSDPGAFVFYENWTNEAALADHAASAHMAVFQAEIADLIAAPPRVETYTRIA